MREIFHIPYRVSGMKMNGNNCIFIKTMFLQRIMSYILIKCNYCRLWDKFCNAHHHFFIFLFFCSFPGATNDTLLEKFHQNHKNSDYYVMPMRRESTFTVKHYAGQVKYHIRVSFTSLLVAELFLWNYTRQWVWVCTNLNLLKLCIEDDQGTLFL